MDEDISLIEKYLSGNEDAIEGLIMKYQKQIYAIAYRMTYDIEDAKDLTQKIFLKTVSNIGGFKKEASFKTWLYRIAVNTCLNHKKQCGHKEIELDEKILSNQAGALSELIENEKGTHIRTGLDELPERQRLAIILRVHDGLTCIETAKIMGCSEGAVKAHYHNGVKKIREFLRGKGYEIKS